MDKRQMDKRQAVRLLGSAGTAVAAALLAGGCESYSDKMLNAPGPRARGPAEADVTAAESNSARLQSLPAPVQSAFASQYPGVTVTQVRMQPTGTGAMFYRIVFIQGGRPGQAVYRGDGRDTAGEEAGTTIHRDEEFVPLTRPAAPTTLPAGANFQ